MSETTVINMDGVSGAITGQCWKSKGLFNDKLCEYLCINVHDSRKTEPYSSGYITTYHIPITQLREIISE